MERDTDSCLFTVVNKSKFKALLLSRKYERRNRGILVGKEKLADGREDFIVLDTEWAMWEKCERSVLEEIQRVSDDNPPIVIEQPIPPISVQPTDNIPAGDKAAATRLGVDGGPLPNHPESSRRPGWYRSGFDRWGGR